MLALISRWITATVDVFNGATYTWLFGFWCKVIRAHRIVFWRRLQIRALRNSWFFEVHFYFIMALNPAYEAIGKHFVQQYYAMFDDPAQRPNLINMYNTESSFMTFEGMQLQGSLKIMEKLTADEDPPHPFCQTFVLKPLGNSFFCQHDMFRLGIHDTAWREQSLCDTDWWFHV